MTCETDRFEILIWSSHFETQKRDPPLHHTKSSRSCLAITCISNPLKEQLTGASPILHEAEHRTTMPYGSDTHTTLSMLESTFAIEALISSFLRKSNLLDHPLSCGLDLMFCCLKNRYSCFVAVSLSSLSF